jgi:hypothetical protein
MKSLRTIAACHADAVAALPKFPPIDPERDRRGDRPTYTLDRQIAEARREMGEARWAELNKEWDQ